MEKISLIFKSIVSALPFIIIVITFVVARSIYLMKRRNTGFRDWILKDDRKELPRLFAIEEKRCPDCGTAFSESQPLQKCRKCGYELMAKHEESDAFLNFMHKRYLRQVIPVSVVLSFFPLVGFIAGIIYLRYVIIIPFAQYIPFVSRFKTAWSMRILVWGLALFQILPGFGAVSVPLVAYVKYWFFSSTYQQILEEQRKGLLKS